MKKSSILILSGLATATLLSTSCGKSEAAAGTVKPAPENGAQYKEGRGLSLTEEMKKSIGFKTAEVTEEEISSIISFNVTATEVSEARGPLTAKHSSLLKPGMEIALAPEKGSPPVKGIVRQIGKIPFGTPGELEAIVSVTDSLVVGSTLQGSINLPASGPVAAVPPSAVLTTAEGTFVYAVNGSSYVRTPVKTGVSNDGFIEISDGLYPGDEIVIAPVMPLWMAELQVLRGGKACTCGH